MEELGTRRTTERVRVGNSPPKDARAAILPGRLLQGSDELSEDLGCAGASVGFYLSCFFDIFYYFSGVAFKVAYGGVDLTYSYS